MYALSDEQIEHILRDIKSRGVEMEDLQVSLLDHICCIIESELEPGGDFDSFYRKTIPRFFKKELREIEEETILLLTFKNYYAMRKTMIITGTISVAAFIFGSFLKIMHWPGAAVMLFLGILAASLIFMPLLFILKTRESGSGRDKVVMAVGTVFGILISISVLFKVMHWPYANVMWLTSLGILLFGFIPIYFFSGIQNPETKINTITSSMLILFAGGLLFTLTNLRGDMWNSFTFPDSRINSMHESVSLNNLAMYAKAEKDSLRSEKVLKVKALSEEMSKYISQLKMHLLVAVDPDLINVPESEIKFNQMGNKDNIDIPGDILFGHLGTEQPNTGPHSAFELKSRINAYKTELLSLLDENSKAEVSSYMGLKTDDVSASGRTETWESYYFFHNPIIGIVTTLDQVKNEVSYAELVILSKLVK